jgi:hypothetical protein
MASDIVKLLVDDDGEASAALANNPLIDKMLDGDAPVKASPNALLPKIVSAVPLVPQDKQTGDVSVVVVTPYGATETKGILKAIAGINKDIGKIGIVFHEGSFEIGRKLPKLLAKYHVSICVRDHPGHLKAFRNLGGLRNPLNPSEEVRGRLDDEDRLLRASEEEAFLDMLEMARGTTAMVIMPGSSRMALAEQVANLHGITPVLAAQQSDLDYADDIAPAPLPVTLLVVTPEDFSDVGAIVMARTHLNYLGHRIGKIVFTPSMAMEVISGLNDGVLYREITMEDAMATPFRLFENNPNFAVVAGDTPLTAAVLNIALHRKPPVPCAEIP